MGLNAFFTFTVVFGLGYEWQTALGAVFISGLLFVVLSATGARAWIINGIPLYLKYAITAGIGLFLAIIGFQTGGITIGDPATLVGQGEWLSLEVAIGLVGFIVMASLLALRVKGALIIGIALVTVLAILTDAQVYVGPDGPTSFQGFNDGIIGFTWPGDLIGALDISGALGAGILGVAFTFLFVDFFDTAGTLIGLSDKAGMLDEKGHIQAPRQAFVVDGTATTVGAVLGTSSTTTYVESAAGVEDGARTGLAAVTVGVLFLLATVLSPLASVIPAVATAPVLIIIGAMMMTGAAKIEWTDYRVAIPAFVTIVGMPFTYSITAGIALGIISYTLISVCVGKWREVHVVMYILTALLLLWASGVFL